MSARRSAKRQAGHVRSLAIALGLVLAVAALPLAVDVLRAAGVALVLALGGGAGYLGARYRTRAEVGALRAKLADAEQLAAEARESAELAWDAAADRPARSRRPAAEGDRGYDARRAELLADPRSGVRPLVGGR